MFPEGSDPLHRDQRSPASSSVQKGAITMETLSYITVPSPDRTVLPRGSPLSPFPCVYPPHPPGVTPDFLYPGEHPLPAPIVLYVSMPHVSIVL